jgi:hypothetical protein
MSPILIALACLYPLIGGGGLIAFIQAARRTNEDWEQSPASRQIDQTLLRDDVQIENKPGRSLASRIRQA